MHWDAPKYLKRDLVPIVGAIYDRIEMKTKPPGGIVIAHSGGVGSYHICTQRCLKNIPLQACSNVCGIAMAILGGIACAAPRLWGGCNLNRKADIPATLQWLSNPSTHSDFLRCVIISWLITNTLDVSLIGVDPENIPRPKSVPTSRRRQRTSEKVVVIDLESEGKGGANGTCTGVSSSSRETVMPSKRRKQRGMIGDPCEKREKTKERMSQRKVRKVRFDCSRNAKTEEIQTREFKNEKKNKTS